MREQINKLKEAAADIKRDASLAKLEKLMAKEVAGIFKRQRNLYMQEFKKAKGYFKESAQDPDNIIDRVLAITEDTFKEAMTSSWLVAVQTGMLDAIEEFDVPGIVFKIDHPRAESYILKHGAELVTRINDGTRDQIHGILVKGREEGWSYNKAAREIEQRFTEFAIGKPQKHIRSRAELVAVTETANAYGEGNMEAAEQIQEAGLTMEHSWHTVGDDSVSDGCQDNEAAGWLPLNEPFPSGHLREPRFPGCRCNVHYRRMQA